MPKFKDGRAHLRNSGGKYIIFWVDSVNIYFGRNKETVGSNKETVHNRHFLSQNKVIGSRVLVLLYLKLETIILLNAF